jgi:hypothetical protein
MTTLGLWQYPFNPPEDFTKHQLSVKAGDHRPERLDTDNVSVTEDIALELARTSPNPQKAANSVFLLAANGRLKLLPLAALLFASAGR